MLNQAMSCVIAGMGHMDKLVIGDAGLPIPMGVQRIDLALKKDVPGFIQTVETVVQELCVENVIVAKETKEVSPGLLLELEQIFPDVSFEFVSHDELKKMSEEAIAVIRTGEFTPYANVILVSGVSF
jgi:D-ribose pyranase